MGQWMQQHSPHEIVYAFMTRTGRMSDLRLAQQYPALYEQWVTLGIAEPQALSAPLGHAA